MPDISSVFYLQCSLVILALVGGWGCWRKIVSAEAKLTGTIRALCDKLEMLSAKISVVQTAQVTYAEQVRDEIAAQRESLADGIKTLSGLTLKILDSESKIQALVTNEGKKVLTSQSKRDSAFITNLESIQLSIRELAAAANKATETVVLHIEKVDKKTQKTMLENTTCLTSVLKELTQQVESVVAVKNLTERRLKDLVQQEKILTGVADSHTIMVQNLKGTFETSGKIVDEIAQLLETSKGVVQLLKLVLLDSLVMTTPATIDKQHDAARLKSKG